MTNSAGMPVSTCYNCGNTPARTREHVIAKTLIPRPYPLNLLTVPACEACNQAVSKDEEYLRDRLSATPSGFKTGQWETTLRSIKRPDAHGKKIGLYKDIYKLNASVMTEEGPSDAIVKMNKARADRVAEKIVKGLFFHLFDRRLVGVEFSVDIPTIHRPGRNIKAVGRAVEMAIRNLCWKQTFGQYTWAGCCLIKDDQRGGIWLVGLLGEHLIFTCSSPLVLVPNQFED